MFRDAGKAGNGNGHHPCGLVRNMRSRSCLSPIPKGRSRRASKNYARRFGFTPAEAAFALEIVKGDGRQAAADRRGITVGTARSHLSRIFDKTGVSVARPNWCGCFCRGSETKPGYLVEWSLGRKRGGHLCPPQDFASQKPGLTDGH